MLNFSLLTYAYLVLKSYFACLFVYLFIELCDEQKV